MAQDLLNKIIRLPRDFYNNELSIHELLKSTGYFEYYDFIKQKTILEALEKSEEYINDWLEWSANKRITFGWYFKREDNKYLVGYLDPNNGNSMNNFTEFSDSKNACAYYIKNEIEEIRNPCK